MQPLEPAIRLPVVRRSAALLMLLLVFLWSGIEPGRAEGYPERTIKLVVPFPAGGPTDVAARLVAQALAPRLGQNVIVENQSGAGGRIGAKNVARAGPGGDTFLLRGPQWRS